MKIRKILLILLIVSIIISPVSAQLADTPSPTLKGNLKRDGSSPYATSIEKPYLKWKFNAENGVESAPAIGPDGTLYFCHFGGNLFALNPDGTEKWRFSKENERFSSSPTIDQDGTVYFISSADMRKEFNPTFNDYDDFGIPTLYALNTDGTEKWKFVLGGLASGILYSPAIGNDGTIYSISGGSMKAGTTNDPDILKGNSFWALNPDGTEKWRFKMGDAQYSAPVISDDGTIYIGCADKNFYAINPDGTEKWRFNTEEKNDGKDHSFSAVPSIGPDGTIYIGSKNRNLYALSPEGKEKWHFTMLDRVEASPSFGLDGTIYTGAYSPSNDPYLYAINPENGQEIWRFETGQGVYGSPAVDANGILFFGSYDSYLYSLNPDGTERWRFKTNGGINMPPVIGSDGTVYFGSWDYYLYAIDGIERQGEVITGTPKEKKCDPGCTDSNKCTVCTSEYPKNNPAMQPGYEIPDSTQTDSEEKNIFQMIIDFFSSLFGL